MKRKTQANALILALSVMFILASLGICFSQLMILENRAALNYSEALSADFLAQAGLEYAVLKLRQDFNQDLTKTNRDWLYRRINGPADYTPSLAQIGEAPKTTDPDPTAWPSYMVPILDENLYDPVKGRRVSGKINDEYHVYTLKILDTSCQINLNSMINVNSPSASDFAVMGLILDNLSKNVATATGYPSTDGPLKGLGKQIIKYRNTIGGFTSKNDIVGKYTADNGDEIAISKEDLAYIWDYITVHPTVAEMKEMSICRTVKPYNRGDETFQKDYRSPVNINTASRSVLIALIQGLSFGTIVITSAQATVLADKIMAARQKKQFSGLEALYAFLDLQDDNIETEPGVFDTGTFYGLSDAQDRIDLLKANFDPNVSLRRINPDCPVYQRINKTDLTHYTIEFCYFPIGRFEIMSLGQILDETGTPKVSRQQYAVIKLFDLVLYTTQYDFEGGNSSLYYKTTTTDPDLASRIAFAASPAQGFNAFSYGNNLQKDYTEATNISGTGLWDQSSQTVGYIMPLAYDLPAGNLDLTHPFDNPRNYRFRSDFNGTLDGTYYYVESGSLKQEIASANGEKIASPAVPSDGTTPGIGDLVPDGVLIPYNGTKRLWYSSRKATDPAAGDPYGVFPPIFDAESYGYGSKNRGTLMFWFKIGRNWLDKTTTPWHTIFFSTTWYNHPAVSGPPYICGLQRQIQMRVEGPLVESDITKENPALPLIRNVYIKVLFKFYCYQLNGTTGVLEAKNPFHIPSYYIEYTKEMKLETGIGSSKAFGLHAQEWYHFAMRWYDGLRMDFPGNSSTNFSIALKGTFYCYTDNTYKVEEHFPKLVNDKTAGTGLYIPLQSGDDGDGSGVRTIGGLTVDIPDPDFAALDESEIQQNRFYIGNYKSTVDAKELTIDDVRISNVTSVKIDSVAGIESETYRPGRFPKYTDIDPTAATNYCYGIFQGKFRGYTSGDASFIYWTARPWGDVKLAQQQQNQDLIDGQPESVWLALWEMMSDGMSNSAVGFNAMLEYPTRYQASIVLEVKKDHKGRFKKYLDIEMRDMVTNKKLVDHEFSRDPKFCDPIEDKYFKYTYPVGGGYGTITTILSQWFSNMKTQGYFDIATTLDSFAEEEQLGYTPGQGGAPKVLDSQHEYQYTVQFPIQDTSKPELFQSPIVDDICLIYQNSLVSYLEYYDTSLLP